MIGASIGLGFLIPFASARWAKEPLAERDCYPGVAARSILDVSGSFRRAHPRWREEPWPVVQEIENSPEDPIAPIEAFETTTA